MILGAVAESGESPILGQAHVFSGATGDFLYSLVSPTTENSGDDFAWSVAGVPDVDGDGRGDLLVGVASEQGGAGGAGRAYVYSGATGQPFRTLESLNPEGGRRFGISVAGVPDANGDGRGDLLVGARDENSSAARAYLFYSEEVEIAPPVAVDDMATTFEGRPVVIDVLANDSDPGALTIASVGSPMSGTAEMSLNGIRYTPAAGFVGTDSFAYTVADGNGGTDEGTVTVTVIAAMAFLDPAFGDGGRVTTDFGGRDDWARAIVVQPDGKLVVAGSAGAESGGSFALARYETDGTLDASFGNGGRVTTDVGGDGCFDEGGGVAALALLPDGKLVAAGCGGSIDDLQL